MILFNHTQNVKSRQVQKVSVYDGFHTATNIFANFWKIFDSIKFPEYLLL